MNFDLVNKEKWAYLAGIIDGEGTITITRHIQHKRTSYQYKPFVIVSNTDENLMVFLYNTFGGKYRLHERRVNKGWADYFRWQVMAKSDIENILRNVFEFLTIKNKQAKLVLEYLSSRRTQIANGDVRYTDFEHECYLKVKELNNHKKERKR